MNYLLDTQAFLWIITDNARLSKKAKKCFLDNKNNFYLSIASIWEIAIKISIGKLILKIPLHELIPSECNKNGIRLLEISCEHALKVSTLPFHHRDPFDRLIIVQAIKEHLKIISTDSSFDLYNVTRIW